MVSHTKLLLSCTYAALFVSSSACAAPAKQEQYLIEDYDAAKHDDAIPATARYQIEIHSGGGIPGTAGADQYYREPKKVLQAIVDQCQLGRTIYSQATDGVSLLTIVDPKLSEEKVACIRSAEDVGLRLRDWGTNG